MNAYNFEYDGIQLRDLSYMICSFDSEGLQTIGNGSQITFHTVPAACGLKQEQVGSEYTECLEAVFQICKNPCEFDDVTISPEELRFFMKWLNRREYHKFKLLEEGYYDIYFEASFQISKIEYCGNICGLELTMQTNRPHALQDPRTITIETTAANEKKTMIDTSDEEGYLYPHMEIRILNSGTLNISNSLDNRILSIAGCTTGEIITLDYPMIQSSLASHNIQKDFNWNFLRIANTFQTNRNDLTISLPCSIQLTYSPIAKLGM